MPEFYADWEQMMAVSESMGKVVKDMEEALEEAASVGGNLYCIGKEEENIRFALDRCGTKLEKVLNGTRNCQNVLSSAAEHYRSTENSMFMLLFAFRNPDISGVLDKLVNVYKDVGSNDSGSDSNNGRWSLGHGEWAGTSNILGLFDLLGTASWEFMAGSLRGTGTGFQMDFKNGNVGIDYGYEGDFNVFSVSGQSDYHIEGTDISGTKKGKAGFLNLVSNGKIGASLFRDGKFAPGFEAALEGKGSVLGGNVESSTRLGDNEIRVGADGDVLGAEAGVDVGFGSISYQDRNGNTKYADGAKLKIGAEAYVAKGRVSQGITVLGIDIDVGLSGTYEGVGASGELMKTNKCVKAQLGAELGLGLDIDFAIDWSNFSWDKLDILGLF